MRELFWPVVMLLVSVLFGRAYAAEAELIKVRSGHERIYSGAMVKFSDQVAMDPFLDGDGAAECVQLVKSLLNAPHTGAWIEGYPLLEYAAEIRPGTPIATFEGGRYPQGKRPGGYRHAAIFLRASAAGIFVLDQFKGKKIITERFIPWHNRNDPRPSNNAYNYSTVRW